MWKIEGGKCNKIEGKKVFGCGRLHGFQYNFKVDKEKRQKDNFLDEEKRQND